MKHDLFYYFSLDVVLNIYIPWKLNLTVKKKQKQNHAPYLEENFKVFTLNMAHEFVYLLYLELLTVLLYRKK